MKQSTEGHTARTTVCEAPKLFPLCLPALCPFQRPVCAGLSIHARRLLAGPGVGSRRESPGAATGLGACRTCAAAGLEGGGPSWPPGPRRRQQRWCAAGAGRRSPAGPWRRLRTAKRRQLAGRPPGGAVPAAAGSPRR